MKSRCLNKNNKSYSLYGGAGIKVCRRWLRFDNFLEDMGECPPGLELDRVKNEFGYSKRNCRWASEKTQSENRRSTKWVKVGDDFVSMREASIRLGLRYQGLKDLTYKRGKWGLSGQEAVDRLLLRRAT